MIFRNYLSKIIFRLNIIHYCAKFLGVNCTFFIIKILINKINKKGSINLLCIGRPIFNEDIRGMAMSSSKINYWIIPKEVFLSIFKIFLNDLITRHQDYHFIKGYEKNKKAYNKFLCNLIKLIKNSFKIDGIITANYNYSWQQEIASVSKVLGIPFIILFKEGISPLFDKDENYQIGYKKLIKKFSNKNFIGDKLLLYNDRTKSAFLSEKIKGLSPSMIKVVGIPRFDRYLKLKKMGTKICFFSFNILDKSRHLNLEEKIISEYAQRTYKFHEEIILFAKHNRNIDLIIKTKSNYKHIKYVKNILKELNCLNLKNIKLVNNGDVFNIIKNSYSVIGFNSTVLLEAFISKRIVFTPDFRGGHIQTFFDEYKNLPNYVNTSKQLENYLSCIDQIEKPQKKDLKIFLKDRIHFPDGKSGKRAVEAILETIKNYEPAV